MAAVAVAPNVNGKKMSTAPTTDPDAFPLAVDNINPNVRSAEYAVRGEIVLRAGEIEQDLKNGKPLPFDKVIYCNVGNPQILGQKPLTFLRQVMVLVDYPQLLDDPATAAHFPSDAITRAKRYLKAIPSGSGAYTDSRGSAIFREHVAVGMTGRDGYPADPDNIFMTDGASPGVHLILKMLIRNENDCILTPIPQYPLYSACLALYGGTLLPYYLDEEKSWALSIDELKAQVEKARSNGQHVRGLVVINPGNPTGNVLDYDNQTEIVQFCKDYGICLLADEVYQTNIYAPNKKFHSFKKVLMDVGHACRSVPLVSFNSTSKGFFGECGRRGGYFEAVNLSPELKAQLYKLASINLCPNTNGQITMACMMHSPLPGDASWGVWEQEMTEILMSLKLRAKLVVEKFRQLKGVTCNETEGALYAFPRLEFPEKFLEEAKKIGKPADFVYCKRLLEETGIVTIPGSGFKQVPGTYHLRTTILPPLDELEIMTKKIEAFHSKLWETYG